MLRVLYTDVDGTLTRDGSLLHGQDGPSTAGAEALVRLHRLGIEVVPTSGRSARHLGELGRAVGARSFVAELGAVIGVVGGETVATYDGPPARRALEEAGVVDRVLALHPGRLERHEPWASRREHTVLLRGNVDVASVASQLPPGYQVVDNGPIGRPPGSRLDVDVVRAYHLSPAGVDKAHGVRFDLKRRGLAGDAAAFVGDSPGDARLVGVVGRVVLLGERADGCDHVPGRFGEAFREAVGLLLGK